jgi:hypothetical protein
MYLSELEEIIAYIVCIAIIMGFGITTYMEIKNTIGEEKEKYQEKKENEKSFSQCRYSRRSKPWMASGKAFI